MKSPLQITYRNVDPSQAIDSVIRSEAAKLDRYYGRITSCRVILETLHRHSQRSISYNVKVELGVPREELIVKHIPALHLCARGSDGNRAKKSLQLRGTHKDLYEAIHDAFRTARRQLEDFVRRLRGDVKVHKRLPPFRVEKLAAEDLPGVWI